MCLTAGSIEDTHCSQLCEQHNIIPLITHYYCVEKQ